MKNARSDFPECNARVFFLSRRYPKTQIYDDNKQKKRRKSSLKMGNEQLLMIQSITNTVNLVLID